MMHAGAMLEMCSTVEEQAVPGLLAKEGGEAPPTGGFFSWLPELPAPSQPGRRAPRGIAAALPPTTEPAIAIVALERDIVPELVLSPEAVF